MNEVLIDCVKCGRVLDKLNKDNLKEKKVPRMMRPFIKKALKDTKKLPILYRVMKSGALPKCEDYGLKCREKKEIKELKD